MATQMKAYYNEHDKSAAAWLRELIKEKVITDGIVDERSIEDVVPAELAEFDRCHFFAGIGVWDYALTRAGWPDDRRVWTGSCPCQPFSAAGKGDGFADERHLWPAWFHLIEQCRPGVIFGEQVSSKDTLPWIDLVHADLEGALYTVAAADLCSPSVGAPHIRQRLYFVAESGVGLADAHSGQSRGHHRETNGTGQEIRLRAGSDAEYGRGTNELAKPVSVGRRGRSDGDSPGHGGEIQIEGRGGTGQLADALPAGPSERRPESGNRPIAGSGGSGDVEQPEYTRHDRPQGQPSIEGSNGPERGLSDRADSSCDGQLGNSSGSGFEGSEQRTSRHGNGNRTDAHGSVGESGGSSHGVGLADTEGTELSRDVVEKGRTLGRGPTNGFWRDAEWIHCRDGKWRPVGTIESGAFEMADGLAADLGCVRDQSSGRYTISPLIEKGKGRVARLRGYGNAIVAEVAVKWIEAYLSNNEQIPKH